MEEPKIGLGKVRETRRKKKVFTQGVTSDGEKRETKVARQG